MRKDVTEAMTEAPLSRKLLRTFERLPLFEDLYLRMQAQNIALVDSFLSELETQLLEELLRSERTPIPETMFASALSQMWVFAVYELLRTWRQRIREILEFGDAVQQVTPRQRRRLVEQRISEVKGSSIGIGVSVRREQFKRVATKRYYERLKRAETRVMPIFRRIEALRVTLAKHEVPKTKGFATFAPGYGRIHPLTSAISWQIELRDGTLDGLSRREIADDLRRLWTKHAAYLGPSA